MYILYLNCILAICEEEKNLHILYRFGVDWSFGTDHLAGRKEGMIFPPMLEHTGQLGDFAANVLQCTWNCIFTLVVNITVADTWCF